MIQPRFHRNAGNSDGKVLPEIRGFMPGPMT
jgi:hypothetical protein